MASMHRRLRLDVLLARLLIVATLATCCREAAADLLCPNDDQYHLTASNLRGTTAGECIGFEITNPVVTGPDLVANSEVVPLDVPNGRYLLEFSLESGTAVGEPLLGSPTDTDLPTSVSVTGLDGLLLGVDFGPGLELFLDDNFGILEPGPFAIKPGSAFVYFTSDGAPQAMDEVNALGATYADHPSLGGVRVIRLDDDPNGVVFNTTDFGAGMTLEGMFLELFAELFDDPAFDPDSITDIHLGLEVTTGGVVPEPSAALLWMATIVGAAWVSVRRRRSR